MVLSNIDGCTLLKGLFKSLFCFKEILIETYIKFRTYHSNFIVRFIRTLKDKVRNPTKVEGSICEAYLVEETSTFASYYYPPDTPSRRTRLPRNDDGGDGFSTNPPLSIFNYPGRPSGKHSCTIMEEKEIEAAKLYVLLNCPEVEPFLE